MARLYRSARGKIVDMEKLRQAGEREVAMTGGSQHVNARGDELGPGGRIIRTREEIIKSYNRNNPNAVPESSELVPDAPQKVPTPDADVVAHQRTTMNDDIPAIPIDELYVEEVTEEDKQNLVKVEERRHEEMNRRTREMREKRQRQSLAEQGERIKMEEKRVADFVNSEVGKEKLEATVESAKAAVAFVEAEVKIDPDVLNKPVEKPKYLGPKYALEDILNTDENAPGQTQILKDKDGNSEVVFRDMVTGKKYKTKTAMKGAITRREKKAKADANIEESKDDGTDKGFEWVE